MQPRSLRVCAVHQKTWYASKGLAEVAIQRLPVVEGEKKTAYRCDATDEEELWHFGTERERKAKTSGGLVYQSATPVVPPPLTQQLDLSHVHLNGHQVDEYEAEPEPEAHNSIERLLAAAEGSNSEVAKNLAAQIRALLVELIDEIRYGEQERLLSERAETLRKELEETLRQIERLRGEPEPQVPETSNDPSSFRGNAPGTPQAEIRQWAKHRKMKGVNDRGALPVHIVEAYKAAMAEVAR